jgi:ADP-ribose pyrophosphatase YjhB (NUDIX family)
MGSIGLKTKSKIGNIHYNMKIFFDDRTIELLDAEPRRRTGNEMITGYSNPDQMRALFQAFRRDFQWKGLVVWPENPDLNVREDFFSLFKQVNASGGVVRNEKKEVLFIFRLGKWDLPKGKLKKQEDAEEGAIREVMEETGLSKLKILTTLPSTFHIYERKGKQILKQTFWFGMEAKSAAALIPQTEEDISEVRWIPVNEVNSLLENTYDSIRELMKSAEIERLTTE